MMDDNDFIVPDEEVEVVYLDDEVDSDDDDEKDMEEFGSVAIGELEEGIQAEVIDLSKYTFTKHGQSVFSSDLSKNGKMAVTGGEDEMAYVWSTETGDVLFECTGHKDSVTEVSFNYDNTLIATGDMRGLIQVWNVTEKKLIWCYEVDDVEFLLWHHLSNVLVCGTQLGDIYVWQVPQGNCKVLPSHGAPTICGKILPDGKRLVIGYADGKLKLWSIKSASVEWQSCDTPEVAITSLDLTSDGNLVAVAPMGQVIKTNDGRAVGAVLADKGKDVEAVAFNDRLGLIATGSLSGRLCVWDVGKYTLRHEAKIEATITIMKWTVNDKLVVGAADGAVYVCDGKMGTLLETLTGHTAAILSLSISGDGLTVLATSDDGTAKIFSIKA